MQYEGYRVTAAYDGWEGIQAAREASPDLLVLDWMLPGVSGLEICQRLREMHDKVPIVLLTAKDSVRDHVQGLDAGADDYLVKPFSIEKLFARIRAHLRREQDDKSEAELLQLADLRTPNRTSAGG